jgi:hypothetical protein
MIKLPDKEGVILEFTSEFDAERSKYIPIRVQNFTQQEIADWLGKSLRTIQHFEKPDASGKFRNYDPYILTGYRVMVELINPDILIWHQMKDKT